MFSLASAFAILAAAAVAVFLSGPGRPPFREEIDRFAALDKAQPPPPCEVLFVGDSSIRLWTTLAGDMAPLAVINRGFGGSQIPHINRYFGRIVRPYRPKAIVFYAGENDLASGKTPNVVFAHFERFMRLKTKALGETPVYFISVNPSKALFSQLATQREFNAKVEKLSKGRNDLAYVDVATPMMEGGRPKDGIYVGDGLHMNAKGYAIWKQVVGDALKAGVVDRLPCPPKG